MKRAEQKLCADMNELEYSMLEWMHGPRASAVSVDGRGDWLLLSSHERPQCKAQDARSPGRGLHLGVLMQLRSLRRTERKPGQVRGVVRHPSFLAVFVLLLFAGISALLGGAHYQELVRKGLATGNPWAEALLILGTFSVSASLLYWLEARLLRPSIEGGGSLLKWGFPGVRTLPVVWELGTFLREALVLLVAAALMLGAGSFWVSQGSLMAVGLMGGAWYYLALAVTPFGGSPGGQIFHVLLGTERILHIKEHLILGLFLSRVRPVSGKPRITTLLAGFLTVAWVVLVARSFSWLGEYLRILPHWNGLLLHFFSNLLGLTFSLWMLLQIVAFLRENLVLRTGGGLQSIRPSKAELDVWKSSCALLTQVPELAGLQWNWLRAKAGSVLIHAGEDDHRFYWLSSGEARILGRDVHGQALPLAQLHAGSGFGEIAFLGAARRSADVVMTRDSVVAVLEPSQFHGLRGSAAEKNFRAWVLASQAMDRSEMFCGIPSPAKEAWMRMGRLCYAQEGDAVIEQGAVGAWLGLIAHGDLTVERDGSAVAVLNNGDVFGEMAHWTKTARRARVVANTVVAYVRWESDWWDEETRKLGLDSLVDEMVRRRAQSLDGGSADHAAHTAHDIPKQE